MLVTLTSSTSGDMLIFAKHLRPLFEILGKECTARGGFSVEQLPDAILKLQEACQAADQNATSRGGEAVDADETEAHGEVKVGLRQRAFPLIELMKRTLGDKGFILWEASGDF